MVFWAHKVRAYVDDPLLTLAALTSRASHLGGLVLLLWCSLGLSLSWEKGSFGRQVQWIGTSLQFLLDSDGLPAVRVVLADKKHKEMLAALDFLPQARGMVDLAVVRRGFNKYLWAAISSHEALIRSAPVKRRPGHLFPVKRIYQPLCWIKAVFDGVTLQLSLGITRSIRPRLGPVEFAIQTDACPAGLGAILHRWHKPCQWLADVIHDVDLVRFGARKGDPARQSTWKLLALLVALQVLGPRLRASGTCELEAESMAALYRCGLCYGGSVAHHERSLPFALNHLAADALSRLSLGAAVLAALAGVEQVCSPAGVDSFYKAWPKDMRLEVDGKSVAQPAARVWAARLQHDGGAGWARLPRSALKRVRKPAKRRQSESDDRAIDGVRTGRNFDSVGHGRPAIAGVADEVLTAVVPVGQGRPDFAGEAD
eukprot:6475078-Amphidinium_carterae.1